MKGDSDPIARTFMINPEWDKVLTEDAEKQVISVDDLVNRILTKYALVDRYYTKHQMVTLANETFSIMLRRMPEEDIAEAGRIAGSIHPKERMLAMELPLTFESLLWFLEAVLGRYSAGFELDHHTTETEHIFHARHNLNRKWSIFLGNYAASMFKSIAGVDTRLEIQDKSVTVFIEKPFQSTAQRTIK